MSDEAKRRGFEINECYSLRQQMFNDTLSVWTYPVPVEQLIGLDLSRSNPWSTLARLKPRFLQPDESVLERAGWSRQRQGDNIICDWCGFQTYFFRISPETSTYCHSCMVRRRLLEQRLIEHRAQQHKAYLVRLAAFTGLPRTKTSEVLDNDATVPYSY